MTTRPILFSAPMVRALLDGSKTQTRRVVKPQPPSGFDRHCWFSAPVYGWTDQVVPAQNWHTVKCPYGQPGDRLWVRETCRAHEITDAEAEADTWNIGDRLAPCGLDGVVYLADNVFREIESTKDAADKWVTLNTYRWQRGATVPAIHMPRWTSRITLEIIGVRVERLKDISEADAIAEGIRFEKRWEGYGLDDGRFFHCTDPRQSYGSLWESINGAGSWDANPWVWVVEFKRVQP